MWRGSILAPMKAKRIAKVTQSEQAGFIGSWWEEPVDGTTCLIERYNRGHARAIAGCLRDYMPQVEDASEVGVSVSVRGGKWAKLPEGRLVGIKGVPIGWRVAVAVRVTVDIGGSDISDLRVGRALRADGLSV